MCTFVVSFFTFSWASEVKISQHKSEKNMNFWFRINRLPLVVRILGVRERELTVCRTGIMAKRRRILFRSNKTHKKYAKYMNLLIFWQTRLQKMQVILFLDQHPFFQIYQLICNCQLKTINLLIFWQKKLQKLQKLAPYH